MKFSALFTAFLATLAAASPLVTPEVDSAGLSVRADDKIEETNAYKSAQKQISNLKDGEWYKFKSPSPYTKPSPGETADELKQLQAQLGFNHIAVVVGQVKITEKTIGKGKKARKTIKRDFDATLLDLVKTDKKKAELRSKNFEPGSVYNLIDGAKTTKTKGSKANSKGKAYFEDEDHKVYSADPKKPNHCGTFADYLYKEI